MPAERLRLLSDRGRGLLRRAGAAARLRFRHGRPFSANAAQRVLLLSIDERIPQSQIHAFHAWSGALGERYRAEVREVTVSRYLAASHDGPENATTVCFQTQFDIPRTV